MKNSFILGLIILLISCSKQEIEKEIVPVVPVVPVAEFVQFAVTQAKFAQSLKLIKREVSYLTSSALLKNVRMFSYDGNNRCTEIKIGIIDSSQTNPAFNLKQTLTLNYNGASVLPSSVSSVRTVFPHLVTIFYYKYNSEGLKIQDSVQVKNTAGDPAYRTVKYVYDKDQVYTTPVLSGFPYDNIPFDTLSLLKNGNIERVVSKMKTSTGDLIATYAFTYDKYISPYNKLNIANSLYFENSAIGLGYNVPLETHYMGVTINNMTSWSSGSYTVSFKYVYDADKYPLKKEMILPGNTNPYQVILFEY
ncbi:MAG: hypothetical protein ACR2KX_16730 [Chitinophagaceae bacterium]